MSPVIDVRNELRRIAERPGFRRIAERPELRRIAERPELRRIAERPELRRIAGSKPFHAAAGAGAVATAALRELPARLAKWRPETSVAALEQRASGYMTEVRTRAVRSYDQLARRGSKVLDGKPAHKGTKAVSGKTAK